MANTRQLRHTRPATHTCRCRCRCEGRGERQRTGGAGAPAACAGAPACSACGAAAKQQRRRRAAQGRGEGLLSEALFGAPRRRARTSSRPPCTSVIISNICSSRPSGRPAQSGYGDGTLWPKPTGGRNDVRRRIRGGSARRAAGEHDGVTGSCGRARRRSSGGGAPADTTSLRRRQASSHAPARSRFVSARTSAYGSAASALPSPRLSRRPTAPTELMLSPPCFTTVLAAQRVAR